MKKIFYLLFIMLVFSNCENKKPIHTENPKVTNNDIYEVINWVLLDMKKNDNLEGNQFVYIVDQLSNPGFIDENPNFKEKLTQYFSKNDLRFIDEQLKRKKFKLSQNLLKRKKLISKNDLDNMIDYSSKNVKNDFLKKYTKKYGNKYYNQFSLPIFSQDKKTALIDVNTIFSGGYSLLLTKKDNIWKGKIILMWQS